MSSTSDSDAKESQVKYKLWQQNKRKRVSYMTLRRWQQRQDNDESIPSAEIQSSSDSENDCENIVPFNFLSQSSDDKYNVSVRRKMRSKASVPFRTLTRWKTNDREVGETSGFMNDFPQQKASLNDSQVSSITSADDDFYFNGSNDEICYSNNDYDDNESNYDLYNIYDESDHDNVDSAHDVTVTENCSKLFM